MAKKKRINKVDSSEKSNPSKDDDRKLFAFLAAFLSIIGFVIALIARRDDKYVMYYAKQSLVVFIISAALSLIAQIFMGLGIIGIIINVAVGIIILMIWLLSWIYALSGVERTIPIISEWAEKFDF
jgi:uncharacterized membrane protein